VLPQSATGSQKIAYTLSSISYAKNDEKSTLFPSIIVNIPNFLQNLTTEQDNNDIQVAVQAQPRHREEPAKRG